MSLGLKDGIQLLPISIGTKRKSERGLLLSKTDSRYGIQGSQEGGGGRGAIFLLRAVFILLFEQQKRRSSFAASGLMLWKTSDPQEGFATRPPEKVTGEEFRTRKHDLRLVGEEGEYTKRRRKSDV